MKLSFKDFFKILDSNSDDFITINDFSENLDKIIKFSQKVKDEIFSYLDQNQAGIIN